ncbi:hypothetical protein GCM10022237_46260 [Nocardioides ginsengisoli]
MHTTGLTTEIGPDEKNTAPWPGESYHAEIENYHTYVNLVTDLTFELTRVAEWFCDLIRTQVEPTYQLDEGGLMLGAGRMRVGTLADGGCVTHPARRRNFLLHTSTWLLFVPQRVIRETCTPEFV